MSKKIEVFLITLFFIIFTTFFFWLGFTKYVPYKVSEVGKVFISNESIRHILKVSILNEKAHSLYLRALNSKSEDLFYDSMDLFEASIGFLGSYKKTDNRVVLIEKEVIKILDILNKHELNINKKNLKNIAQGVHKVNNYVENIEKDKWRVLHSKVIKDETQKFNSIVILSYVILFSFILIIVILYMWNKKVLLEKEKDTSEKLLLNQSKVAAVGEMLGNIAHQWRQPLNVITTLISATKLNIEFNQKLDKKDLLESSDLVLKQCMYLSNTIDDFRSFFMSENQNFELVNINNLHNKLDDLISTTFKSNYIQKINNIEPDVYLHANISILIQAFINICNNSKDVFIEKNIANDKRLFFTTIKKDKKFVYIVFTDSGGGICSSIIDKIFEPYFTTKHQSLGTGVGLYMTHQIISKHFEGTISVENKEYEYKDVSYKGAQFIIKLPINTNKK